MEAKKILAEMVEYYTLQSVVTMLAGYASTKSVDISWDADFTLLHDIQGDIQN